MMGSSPDIEVFGVNPRSLAQDLLQKGTVSVWTQTRRRFLSGVKNRPGPFAVIPVPVDVDP